jgi:hypothetical protein
VNEDPRPPVAIRITRPYSTEEELLQHEPETITRTGVTLLGAQQRPQGVVLRFELALSNGNAVLRGEGRVVAYKPNTQDGLGGLTLRFTRLDSRSKSLVDKATALRDQRRQPPLPSGALHPPASPSSTPVLPLAADRRSSLPPQPASSRPPAPVLPPPAPVSDVTIPIDVADASEPSLPLASSSPALPRASSIPPPPPASSPRPPQPETQARQMASPPERDALLGRLRVRARSLDASQVARILERK